MLLSISVLSKALQERYFEKAVETESDRDKNAMEALLNRIPVKPGDVLLYTRKGSPRNRSRVFDS
ncbi:MAG: hypothetical protein ACOX45_09790 [Acutalibacteraceae bacterium]